MGRVIIDEEDLIEPERVSVVMCTIYNEDKEVIGHEPKFLVERHKRCHYSMSFKDET